MKLILILVFALGAVHDALAEDFVFETSLMRLVITPDAVVRSLTEKQNGKERLQTGSLAFAAVKKAGRLIPASALTRNGHTLHVTFGASGADAEYRITPYPDYIVVELVAFHGEGVEEIRLMQLNVSSAHTGGPMPVHWDNEMVFCLMGLSPRVDSKVAGPALIAAVYPTISAQGERAVIVAAPKAQFLESVRKVEQNFKLPSPTLDGKWAKTSEDSRTSYLFTDLTEANADETIRYAKLGGFRYILVYSYTWSTSPGSYPIQTANFPRGEESLKAVIDKCHKAGLKVGIHMLTSFVGKNDPLMRPKPNPWLLKDVESALAADVRADATELVMATALAPNREGAFPDGQANDVLLDDEIIRYGHVNGSKFVQCVRGFAGTRPASHKAGAKIFHLVEYGGSYVADLRTPLKDAISDRVAGVINRCGFDMIYFDGGEINNTTEPGWYWLGQQQSQIQEKSKRELLVQGSGISAWTWHIFSRGTSDDTSAVSVKEFLDHHKIPDAWSTYRNDFLPAELGWAGIFKDEPDRPATMPDEVEYYAVRMLALDSAVSFETSIDALKANGRTGEMLKTLGQYEQLRLGRAVPDAIRQKLETGEWHMTRPGEFHPIRYDVQPVAMPGDVTLKNDFPAQLLKFRLRAAPTLAAVGDPSNIPLLRSKVAVEIMPPASNAILPGSLVRHFELTRTGEAQSGSFAVGPQGADDRTSGNPQDLRKHRALAVQLDVEGFTPDSGEAPVLNLQLESGGKTYRDYYINLDFSGRRTLIMAEPGTNRMLVEFRPAPADYPFKAAMGGFDYGHVVALNLRWMRFPKGSPVRCRLSFVEALEERNTTLRNIEISEGASRITIPAMNTGDYAEYWGDGTVRVFDRNGNPLSTFPVQVGPQLSTGENTVRVKASGSGNVVLTAITLGAGLSTGSALLH
jgi:hypothetical protein